jgi:hypothetical protein
MPKKAKITEQPIQPILEESDSDDDLEQLPVYKTKPVSKPLPELQATLPSVQSETPQGVAPKKKRNISEEQKEILRERLKVAHARKAELAAARKAVKEEEEQNHLAKKQLAILEQARLIKQKQKKEMETIVKATPQGDKPKKSPKVKYVYEEESESEEEVIVVKKKRTPKQPVQQPVAQPVAQPVQPGFQIKFY